MECAVHGLKVERRGIEGSTVPLHHFLVFRMLRLPHSLQEMRVAAHPANVARRACSCSAENPRIPGTGQMIDGLLQEHLVLPAVTEVVLVHHSIPGLAEEIAQPYLAFLASLNRRSTQTGASLAGSWPKRVHVAIAPTHHDLENTVEIFQRDVAPDLDPSPHGRSDPLQGDLQVICPHDVLPLPDDSEACLLQDSHCVLEDAIAARQRSVSAAARSAGSRMRMLDGTGYGAPLHLLNDLIRPQEHRLRHRQPERFGSLEIDDQLDFVGCSTGRSAGLAPFRILSINVTDRR